GRRSIGGGDHDDSGSPSRFTLPKSADIHSLEAWLSLDAGTTLTFAIYGDGAGGLIPITDPDPALQYYAGQVFVSDHPNAPKGGYGDQWQGLQGLDVLLPAGTYWLSMEIRQGDTYNGYAVGSPQGPVTPGEGYASNAFVEQSGTW